MAINNILFFFILFYLFIIQLIILLLIENISNYSLINFPMNIKFKIIRDNDIKSIPNPLINLEDYDYIIKSFF